MNHWASAINQDVVELQNTRSSSPVVVVCEHASAAIPAEFDNLGLEGDALQSHVAWDPGAMTLAAKMAAKLDAVLVASKISRLVYDCNRPQDAPDAMPARSEVFEVSGNANLSDAQKADRVARYYEPFRAAVAQVLASKSSPILVTMHSFTPIYHGVPRDVEIGVLHDSDARLADALLSLAKTHASQIVRRNEPYGAEHGVTHTLKEHALPAGHLNVMLEVRNDLIGDEAAQTKMAEALSNWVSAALANLEVGACKG